MTTSRMHKIMAHVTLIAVLVLCQSSFRSTAIAQTKATVLGTVTNEKDELVPNAKVTAKNTGTNITRETTSNADGLYRIPELAPGLYEVRVEGQGFASEVRGGIDLTVGREAV